MADQEETPALQHGVWKPLADGRKQVIAYQRIAENDVITVALNFSRKPSTVTLPDTTPQRILLSTTTKKPNPPPPGRVFFCHEILHQFTADGYDHLTPQKHPVIFYLQADNTTPF